MYKDVQIAQDSIFVRFMRFDTFETKCTNEGEYGLFSTFHVVVYLQMEFLKAMGIYQGNYGMDICAKLIIIVPAYCTVIMQYHNCKYMKSHQLLKFMTLAIDHQ